MRFLLPGLIIAAIATSVCAGAFADYAKVPLKSIEAITFYQDRQTNARRTKPMPQLTCVGPLCAQYEHVVKVVQCSNMGVNDLGRVQWRCLADLPSPLSVYALDVSCEGWSGPDDSDVLQGSCGLFYFLYKGPNEPERRHRTLSSILRILFNFLIFSVLAFILYSIFKDLCFGEDRDPSDNSGGAGGGGFPPGFNGGGGHGGGNNDGSPPPYDPTSKPSPGANTTPASSTSRSGLGGFWTGLGLGAASAAGVNHLANQRRERERYYREQDPGYGGIGRTDRWNSDRGEGTSRWGRDHQPGHHLGRSHGSGDSSGLGEVRTSSGFCGSSVR